MSKLYIFSIICCTLIVLSSTSAIPLKDQEIEELLYKLQELRHQNDGKSFNGMEPSKLQKSLFARHPYPRVYAKKPTDQQQYLSPVLYSYYTNEMTQPMMAKRMDELDRIGFNQLKRNNIDELDRISFNTMSKRNFDEIDRLAFNEFDDAYLGAFDQSNFKHDLYGRDGRFARKV